MYRASGTPAYSCTTSCVSKSRTRRVRKSSAENSSCSFFGRAELGRQRWLVAFDSTTGSAAAATDCSGGGGSAWSGLSASLSISLKLLIWSGLSPWRASKFSSTWVMHRVSRFTSAFSSLRTACACWSMRSLRDSCASCTRLSTWSVTSWRMFCMLLLTWSTSALVSTSLVSSILTSLMRWSIHSSMSHIVCASESLSPQPSAVVTSLDTSSSSSAMN
mmetsp:Transcript_34094/g.106353  ORF Transcript_34094/g.106353 Transcript_34094/m.106353 type:complete len:218 (+) Transcript_34094:113-766(+)